MTATVESTIVSVLTAAPALAGIVVRPQVIEETDLPPYVVYQKIHGERISDLQGDAGLGNPHFQIDVYAQTASQASTLKDAIRVALLAEPTLNAIMVGESAMFDFPTRLFREIQDFSMWFYG